LFLIVVFVTVATMYLAGWEQNEVVGVLAESSKNSGEQRYCTIAHVGNSLVFSLVPFY
jgi:hypothetical protein